MDIPKVLIQLVLGRGESMDYPLVDLTYWSAHDVLDQCNLVAKSYGVCPECHSAVVDWVCTSCYATMKPGEDELEQWEGLIIAGGIKYVASELAQVWNKVVGDPDVTSMYLPFNIETEEQLLRYSRAHPDDLMEMGSYRLYKGEQILEDLHGRELQSLFEMFLRIER